MISMPASDQPWDVATDSSSSLVSESVTQSVFSPLATPVKRY